MSEFYGDPLNIYSDDDAIDISTTLFESQHRMQLKTPLFNASGVMCTNHDQLQSVLNCQNTGAVVTKSCTKKARQGNPEPRYFDKFDGVENGTINSMGIPNNGIDYYIEGARNLKRYSKPYIVSVSGLSILENIEIIQTIHSSLTTSGTSSGPNDDENNVSAIEFNLSCPNIIGKPQTCYDFDAMDNTLRKVFDVFGRPPFPMGVKLSPYFDMVHFEMAANVLENYSKELSFLTCVNSLGNGLVIDIDTETTVIHPKNGLGGIGGDFIKHTALANVRTFYTLLGDKFDIIGCGGVKSGRDVFEHILCGAKAVQVGSLISRKGVQEFDRLAKELKNIMIMKKYKSIEEFRGKLKTQSPHMPKINSKL